MDVPTAEKRSWDIRASHYSINTAGFNFFSSNFFAQYNSRNCTTWMSDIHLNHVPKLGALTVNVIFRHCAWLFRSWHGKRTSHYENAPFHSHSGKSECATAQIYMPWREIKILTEWLLLTYNIYCYVSNNHSVK